MKGLHILQNGYRRSDEKLGGYFMGKCMIIIKSTSGKEKALAYKEQMIHQLHNYEIVVKETEKEGDATRFARLACDDYYDAVVFVGGDGS